MSDTADDAASPAGRVGVRTGSVDVVRLVLLTLAMIVVVRVALRLGIGAGPAAKIEPAVAGVFVGASGPLHDAVEWQVLRMTIRTMARYPVGSSAYLRRTRLV